MQAAVSQGSWAIRLLPDENLVTDPTRMAHGVLTGIGFLCAGVIFRTGFSIHGLTTAASLWITSVLGILFGAGLHGLGLLGAVVTVLILVVLRLVSLKVPARVVADAEACWSRDVEPGEAVEAALHSVDPGAAADRFEMLDDGRTVLRSWRIKAGGDAELKALAARLAAIPGLSSYKLRTCTSD
jgi:putative Mg2+ transporter-C (MgtC) family protein